MNKKKDLSQEDKETWEKYVNDPSDIYDKDKNIQTKHVKKNRFRFDLHGFSLEDANTKVKDIILSCFENNYKEILLITGKGTHSSNDKNVYMIMNSDNYNNRNNYNNNNNNNNK